MAVRALLSRKCAGLEIKKTLMFGGETIAPLILFPEPAATKSAIHLISPCSYSYGSDEGG
jgi:hypothetical protein